VRIRQEAEAFRSEIIARATGDADRFLAVYRAYQAAQDVTAQRLYLETMEEILKSSKKIRTMLAGTMTASRAVARR